MKLKTQLNNTPTMFLGPRAQISQSWASPPVIVVVLCIVKLQLLRSAILAGLGLAQELAVSTCSAMNNAVDSALEVPQQTALVANSIISKAVTSTIHGAFEAVGMLITALEQLIMFVLEMTIGTWACLTVSMVNIAANEALNATESVVNFANSTIADLVDEAGKGLTQLNKLINGATGLIGTIESFVTGSEKQINTVNLTLGKLQDLHIPTSINDKLEQFRTHIPTYDTAKAEVESLISEPFDLLKTKVQNINVTYRSDLVDVPAVRSATACNSLEIIRAFDFCRKVSSRAVNVICGLLAALIVFLIVYHAFTTIRRWNRREEAAMNMHAVPIGKPSSERVATNMTLMAQGTGGSLEARAIGFLETKREATFLGLPGVWAGWLVSYVLYEPARSVLVVGLIGFAITLLEYIVVRILSAAAKDVAPTIVAIATNATAMVKADMLAWQDSTNQQIRLSETDVNDNLLGWARTGSAAVNNTLSGFMDHINGEINSTFGDTVFYQPLNAAVACLIGNKVAKVEQGLTWIHDKARVSLPRIDVISANGTNSTNSTADAGNLTVMRRSVSDPLKSTSSLKSSATEGLQLLVDSLYSQMKIQVAISSALVGVWLLFVLGGVAYAWYASRERPEGPNVKPFEIGRPGTVDIRSTRFFAGPVRAPAVTELPSPARATSVSAFWLENMR